MSNYRQIALILESNNVQIVYKTANSWEDHHRQASPWDVYAGYLTKVPA